MSAFQTEFRASRVAWVVNIASLAIASFFIAGNLLWGAPRWCSVIFWALALGALVAIVQVWLTRVQLTSDGLYFRSGFESKFLPRKEIVSVTWEKGCGVSLKLVSGKWQKLPEVGRGAQAVTNSIRAWLKATSPAASSAAVV